jgi:hypothetical protein
MRRQLTLRELLAALRERDSEAGGEAKKTNLDEFVQVPGITGSMPSVAVYRYGGDASVGTTSEPPRLLAQ